MSQVDLQQLPRRIAPTGQRPSGSELVRLLRYTIVKGVILLLTVAVSLYLTILVVNLGGYVDEIFRSQIAESIGMRIYGGWLRGVPEPERSEQIAQAQWEMEEAAGLHQPFLTRTGRWLFQAMTLDLGEGAAGGIQAQRGWQVGPVAMMVLERLPFTLVLVGISNLLLFLATVWAALVLSGRHGGLRDRMNALVQAVTSAPPWIHGVALIVLLAGQLHWLPFPRRFDVTASEVTVPVARLMLKQMIMPVLAIFISGFFQGVYAWRSYFLIYRDEDYVELAKAKGLAGRFLERRYILRPTLPYVLTSFALTVVGSWQGAIALENLFYWPGIGVLFLGAVRAFNTPLILGVLVIFAYMLAVTLFVVDIACAVVDPRVRLGNRGQTLRIVSRRVRGLRWRRRRKESQVSPSPTPSSNAGQHALPAPSSSREKDRPARLPMPRRSRGRGLSRSTTFVPLLREVARRPLALLGSAVIACLLAASLYAVVAIPYDEAVAAWRAAGGAWYQNPKAAQPVWVNWFRRDKLPRTIVASTRQTEPSTESSAPVSLSRRLGNVFVVAGTTSKEVVLSSAEVSEVRILFGFDFPYGEFPQDVVLYVDTQYAAKRPYVSASLTTPDGRALELGTLSIMSRENAFYLSQDAGLQRRYGEGAVMQGLFGDPTLRQDRPVNGAYWLLLDGLLFEQGSDLDVELVVHGRVSGLAGTDDVRRDLMLPLLWGTPVALAFGLLAALGTSLFSMAFSALGVWLGGWVDGLVQRLTEVFMILPTLPVAVLVYIMYSKTILAVLGVVVLLNIFGSPMRSYRAAFQQMRDAPYIEAAQAYGASGPRIVLHYLLLRILPTLIPQIVILIPTWVYYETTLAYLGVSDPYLPTWGKVIHDAVTSGQLMANPYWPLQPIVLLVLTSLAFTSMTFALDRVLNPRLREQ